jgi:hypothetical protein
MKMLLSVGESDDGVVQHMSDRLTVRCWSGAYRQELE